MQWWLIVFTGTVSVSARHADTGHRVWHAGTDDCAHFSDNRTDCLAQWLVGVHTGTHTGRLLPAVAAAADGRRCAAKLHEFRIRVHNAHIHVHVLAVTLQLLLLR